MLNSDVYVMIPVQGAFKEGTQLKKDVDVDKYINKISETIEFECKRSDYDNIERFQIGSAEFAYYKDDLLVENTIEWIKCHLVLTIHKKSKLGILQMIFTQCEKEDSQIGGIVFSDKIKLKINDKVYELIDFLALHGLSRCGYVKIAYCNSRKLKNDDTINFILAGETSIRPGSPFGVNEENKKLLKEKNYSKFDFYDLYACECAVVYLFDNYSNKYIDNIEWEVLLIYICEIAVLQNAAIGRVNDEIVKELSQNSDISLKKMKKLKVHFGKTIIFWDNNIFNFNLAQRLSNDIAKVFGNKELLNEYNKNNKHLQEIVNIKDAINSKYESIVLNILAILLGIGQLFEFIINFKNMINGHGVALGAFSSSIALLVILMIFIKKKDEAENK